MNGAVATMRPDAKLLEEQLKKYPQIKDQVHNIITQGGGFKAPIQIQREKHSVDDIKKIQQFNVINSFFNGKIPTKEEWEALNNRPNITQDEYKKLKEGQDKETKPIELTEEEKEAIKNYKGVKEEKKKLEEKIAELEKDKGGAGSEELKKLKEELEKWNTAFPNLDPQKVKEKYDQLPTTELSEAEKEAIKNYVATKAERDKWQNAFAQQNPEDVLKKVEELEKRPTKEGLEKIEKEKEKLVEKVKELESKKTEPEKIDPNDPQNAVRLSVTLETNKALWEHVDKLTEVIRRAIPASHPDLNSEGDKPNENKPK